MDAFLLLFITTSPSSLWVEGTSLKMDFLSSGTVRTDPLQFSQTGDCLSDHVHRFYGAASGRTMRPGVTFQAGRPQPARKGRDGGNCSAQTGCCDVAHRICAAPPVTPAMWRRTSRCTGTPPSTRCSTRPTIRRRTSWSRSGSHPPTTSGVPARQFPIIHLKILDQKKSARPFYDTLSVGCYIISSG